MRAREDTLYTYSTITVLSVIQEPTKISTTPAWHLTTRKSVHPYRRFCDKYLAGSVYPYQFEGNNVPSTHALK